MDADTEKMMQETFPFPVHIAKQSLTEAWQKLGVRSELFILIRPDTHIAYIADEFDVERWKKYLAMYFVV